MLKWGLPGEGSNLLKSRRPLMSRTPGWRELYSRGKRGDTGHTVAGPQAQPHKLDDNALLTTTLLYIIDNELYWTTAEHK